MYAQHVVESGYSKLQNNNGMLARLKVTVIKQVLYVHSVWPQLWSTLYRILKKNVFVMAWSTILSFFLSLALELWSDQTC